jgi:hypothetical protein
LHLLKRKYHLLALEPMQAVSHFEVAVTKEPNLPVVHYLLGLAYLSGEQNQLALRSFIEAVRIRTFPRQIWPLPIYTISRKSLILVWNMPAGFAQENRKIIVRL